MATVANVKEGSKKKKKKYTGRKIKAAKKINN